MNLKSFPGPQPHIRVGGVVVLGETRGDVGDRGLQPDFLGGGLCASAGGPLPQRFPRLMLLPEQWGQGAPAAC